MTREHDIETLIAAIHALTRIAALETGSEAPAAQWRTLTILRDAGALRVGELAARSRVSQPGMTRLIGQMADAGLVSRGTDADDSRATVVSATPAGLAALISWREELAAALSPRFARISDEEWRAVHATASLLDTVTRESQLDDVAEALR